MSRGIATRTVAFGVVAAFALAAAAPSGAAVATADPGVSSTQIVIGTTTPLTGPASPGYKDVAPAAQAYFNYVNANGGINGRKIVVDHRDAALSEYQQRMLEACDEDFFMVGGGAVFDDSGQPDRLACGLPDISGFMVTSTATESDLHLEPVPNAWRNARWKPFVR